jgi:Protein of unknown function (DUF4238)
MNLLTYASASAEDTWNRVETHLAAAIQVARNDGLPDGGPESDVIKNAIALHLVRNQRYLDIHHTAASASLTEIRREAPFRRAHLLKAEFHRRYGLHAAGPDALRTLLDEPLAGWEEFVASGALARISMESMFERICTTLRPLSVQVWHTPAGHDLLISDSPAFTFRYNNDFTAIETNMAIGDSHGVAFPIARDCLVSIGPNATDGIFSPDDVELFNSLQIQVARQYVYYRQGSILREWVRAAIAER